MLIRKSPEIPSSEITPKADYLSRRALMTGIAAAGVTALAATDDNGSQFWVFPEYHIAVVNLVNPEGSSPPELPGLLLRALAPG